MLQSNAVRAAEVTGDAPGEGLHDVFAAQAHARPWHIALLAPDARVSYGELDARAEEFARRLAAAGIQQGHLVPILLPRSVDLIVTLLAVLKLGAAYALLDADWPPARLEAVIDQLQPPLVVTRQGLVANLSTPSWTPDEGGKQESPARPVVTVRGSDACSVFFTSGTTGQPKGVVTPHQATARLFREGTFAQFGWDTVIPLAVALPWDVFSLELWSALYNGGTCVLIDEPFLTAEALRAMVADHGVNTAWLTSSLFNLIVEEDLAALSGLSQVMIGGERLSERHVGRFLDRFPDTALINGYGPAESTVFTTTHRITPPDCTRGGGIPLGRPVPGTSVFVLQGNRPCETNEPGEICISGDGLALGYLGDPALTDEKFPHIDINGEQIRLYRTGDLGVRDENGILEYRGRIDRQVKIRGHRVEPAEVERQVEHLVPDVAGCRVVPRRTELDGVLELVAFCVPTRPGGAPPDVPAILIEQLPPYQRPAAVVFVDSFPLTGTGKLDDRALLARVPEAPHGNGHGPAEDPLVRLVAEEFAVVLGSQTVPPHTSFFELGGSSLQAARACTRIIKRVGRPVPLSILYDQSSAEDLGSWLRTAPSTDDAPAFTGDIPLTSIELVFLTRHLTAPQDRSAYCLMTWHLDGRLDQDALETAIATVHERHDVLRTAFRADPTPHAEVTNIPAPPLELLVAQATLGDAVGTLRQLFDEPLEPQDADLWRAALVPVTETGGWLFGLLIHHIAFDGRSESVMARALSDAYARRAPHPAPSVAERARLMTTATATATDSVERLERMRAEFQDVPQIRWPARPDPGETGTGHHSITVPAAVAARLATQGETLGGSLFVVLLSAWADTMAEVCGQRDFAVGVPVAERTIPELEQAIGCLINMVPVRLRGDAVGGGRDGIREVGRLVHQAFGRSEVPFADLAQGLWPATPGRPPGFQTLFALQDNALPRLDLPGIAATHLRQPYSALPLELHLEVWPDEHGALDAVLSYRREAVLEATALTLLKGFHDRLTLIAKGVAS
ncbi:amino acid adenylation domain-containing protein [Streptomyces sp. ME01-18a]|uniref:amino acid adenylation domain-containing protein n=1 Tax=Streptomyces sp. ME01-18a TaxID=3028669 RepID=UPI0029ABDBD9|nr:amino acid adenylation domain-containing protein [Streptomyces sp. ME01-18a]MDX3434231.1 amino acid adenylation domain-containing protein [Streptomyces sp. ME01-18a]